MPSASQGTMMTMDTDLITIIPMAKVVVIEELSTKKAQRGMNQDPITVGSRARLQTEKYIIIELKGSTYTFYVSFYP